MIDFNNAKEVKKIKAIKQYSEWNDLKGYMEEMIKDMGDLENIDTFEDMLGRRLAIKYVRNLIEFIED